MSHSGHRLRKMKGERGSQLAKSHKLVKNQTRVTNSTITAARLYTCVVLAVLTHSTSSDVIAIGKWIGRGIVVAACCMTVTITQLAREAIARGAVAPWFVIVEWRTPLAVISLCVMHALTDRVDGWTTTTRVSITRTPAIK